MPLTSQGYELLLFDEIREAIVATVKTDISKTFNTRPDSVAGLLIDTWARREAALRQEIQLTYAAGSLNASGVALRSVVGNTGTIQIPARKSTATFRFFGTGISVTIPAFKRFSIDGTEQVFTNPDPITIPASPTEVVAAVEAEQVGPVLATTFDTVTIITPVPNLTSVTVETDALVGRFVETDAQIRARQRSTSKSQGGGVVEAIRARLLELAGVTYAAVIPNNLDTSVVVEGISPATPQPGHSILPVVQGGADQDIWDAIWKYGGGGIETFGLEVGTTVDSLGEIRTVRFNRSVTRDVKAEISYTPNAAFPGTAPLITAAVDFVTALGINTDFIRHKLEAHIAGTIGGLTSLSVRIANLADPFGLTNVAVGPIEVASLASGNVTLIVV